MSCPLGGLLSLSLSTFVCLYVYLFLYIDVLMCIFLSHDVISVTTSSCTTRTSTAVTLTTCSSVWTAVRDRSSLATCSACIARACSELYPSLDLLFCASFSGTCQNHFSPPRDSHVSSSFFSACRQAADMCGLFVCWPTGVQEPDSCGGLRVRRRHGVMQGRRYIARVPRTPWHVPTS